MRKKDPVQNQSAREAIKKMDFLEQQKVSFVYDTQWAMISSDDIHALLHLANTMR